MTKVLVIETQLKQYRRRFLVELAASLRARGIELVVAYSEPSGDRLADTIDLPGIGVKVPAHTWGDRVVLQRAWELARDAALVIVGQANGQLLNYALLARAKLGGPRVAYWGHGFNHQARTPGWSERLKRRLVGAADWWFAYTPGVARYVADHGMRTDAITTVYNTIDVDELATEVAAHDVATTKARLGFTGPVGLYCGALVAAKQLGFLADAAAAIRERVPGFELAIVGGGPERAMLEAIAAYRPYLRVVGPAFDAARAAYFAVADVALLPAQLGLAAVDAFAAGLPVITTDLPGHGPEREYLTAATSVVTPFEVDDYAAAVSALLADPARLSRMRRAARARAAELPLARMVEQFTDGISRCLEAR